MKNTGWKKRLLGMSVGTAVLLIAVPSCHPRQSTRGPANAESIATDEYHRDIKPILDSRCVVCHSCYNAPCQLNLTAYEGVERGGSKELVYDSGRLTAIQPTRLFEDAKSAGEWQHKLAFHSVTEGGANSPMAQLLAHKQSHPDFVGKFDAEGSHSCPKSQKDLGAYLRKNPFGGMPYGFPALGKTEYDTLISWLSRHAPGPDLLTQARLERPTDPADEAILKDWEDFLNQANPRVRLVARYIYEHLFLAHVHFDEVPGEFYRLVRSRTAAGAVDEIATRRPYDDPGARFYYRFRRIAGTLVRKTHIVYHLNSQKMGRFNELFFRDRWPNDNPPFPSYDVKVASNPFKSFKDIPARARYQFLLDDALYQVMTFIRGPVCKGNVALNVIDAHFYIMFLKPGSDPTVTDPTFLDRASDALSLPGLYAGRLGAIVGAKDSQLDYLKLRQALYKDYSSKNGGRTLEDIWDGEGVNDNAILTVYRHEESADVIKGAHGGTPKTVWVMDYPIFERIYYDLVAGFDVYGNFDHQMGTRFYMNNLRIEAEDNFLTFLPLAERKPLRDFWYRGKNSDARVRGWMLLFDPYREAKTETRIRYSDPKRSKEEFLSRVWTERFRTPKVQGELDAINSHEPVWTAGDASNSVASREDAEHELAKLTKTTGEFARLFPDASLLRVRIPGSPGMTYTLIHNKAFLNVLFMLKGDHYYDPAADDLHVLRGVEASHPNLFFDIPEGRLGDFVNEAKSLRAKGDSYTRFVSKWGVRRMDPRFWDESDWFNRDYRQVAGLEAGILDLTRYGND